MKKLKEKSFILENQIKRHIFKKRFFFYDILKTNKGSNFDEITHLFGCLLSYNENQFERRVSNYKKRKKEVSFY